MILFLIILAGLAMAIVGYKKSFFPMWALLFNIAISIYMGIMLAPTLADKITMLKIPESYSYILCVFSIALISFVILHGLALKFLIGTFCVSFPSILNSFGAAIIGFFAGSLAAGFIFLLVAVTPLAKILPAGDSIAQTATVPVLFACKTISRLSLQPREQNCEQAIQLLLEQKNPSFEEE